VEDGVKTIQQDLAAQLTRAAERAEAERRAEKERLAAAQQQAAEEAAARQADAAAAVASQPVLPPQVAEIPTPPIIQSTGFHFPYEYHEIKAFKANYIADVDLGSDKKLKAELQQAVNTPLNAISAVTRDHLRDKLTKLTQLLSGRVGKNPGFFKKNPNPGGFFLSSSPFARMQTTPQ
jgi:nucleoporin GLE1